MDPEAGRLIENAKYEWFSREVKNERNNRASQKHWLYNKSLSDDESGVWLNSDEKTVLIAFRGTNFDTLERGASDIYNDIYILFGIFNYSPRLNRGIKLLNKINEYYKGWNIIMTGHSLGGRQAFQISKNCDKLINQKCSSVLFNTGSSPMDTYPTVKPFRNDILSKHVKGDVLSSTFQRRQKGIRKININKKDDVSSPHYLSNFF